MPYATPDNGSQGSGHPKGETVSPMGTTAWLDETGGRLTLAQSITLSGQAMIQLTRSKLRLSRQAALAASEQEERLHAACQVLARAQESGDFAPVQASLGSALYNHSCRSYVLGALLIDATAYASLDQEVAVAAALTHDAGLVQPNNDDRCFTVASAAITRKSMEQRLVVSDRVSAAQDAVVAHFQPKPPSGARSETRLLALGASADIMGFGLNVIAPSIKDDLWAKWPDLDISERFTALLRKERGRAPRSRAAVLSRTGMTLVMRP